MNSVKLALLMAISIATVLTFLACGGGKKSASKGASKPSHGTLTDSRDGKTYKWVKIGCQTWLAENLKHAASGSKCYDDNSANCDKYGNLYNWATAMALNANCNSSECENEVQQRHAGICPKGWHIPSPEECSQLFRFVDGDKGIAEGETRDEDDARKNRYISDGAGKYLKAKDGWEAYEGESGNGEDVYGFTALPSGAYFVEDSKSEFAGIGIGGIWWLAAENGDDGGYACGMENSKDEAWVDNRFGKKYLLSIRCVMDDSNEAEKKACLDKNAADVLARAAQAHASGSAFTDARDGKTYKVVKIGEQAWMAENLAYEAKGSKCYDDIYSYCKSYGKLYDWATAMQACPSGWHLPTRAEWEILAKATGDKETAGKKLKSKKGWSASQGESGNGTDDFGFSALPSVSGSHGSHGAWWSATEHEKAESAYVHVMGNEFGYIFEQGENKSNVRFSVRCVKDANR